jgi:hypothetical protein
MGAKWLKALKGGVALRGRGLPGKIRSAEAKERKKEAV